MRSHNATSAEGEGIITTQTTGTLANIAQREGEKQLTIWGGGARETQHVYRGATDCGDSANHRRNAPQNATSGAH